MNFDDALKRYLPRVWFRFKFIKYKYLGRGEPELRLIRHLVEPGTIAIDVGASIGMYSAEMARYAGKVLAFEPNPDVAAFTRAVARAQHRGDQRRALIAGGPRHADHADESQGTRDHRARRHRPQTGDRRGQCQLDRSRDKAARRFSGFRLRLHQDRRGRARGSGARRRFVADRDAATGADDRTRSSCSIPA